MTLIELCGYLACALVLTTFCMRTMTRLRLVALCSNVAFLIYGFGLNLKPVFVLHIALLGINAWRLWEGVPRHRRGIDDGEHSGEPGLSTAETAIAE